MTLSTRSRSAMALLGALTAVLLALAPVSGATAASTPDIEWAPAGTATIHPGVQMLTDGAQCTANFVFTEPTADDGTNLYLGYAAHCAATGGATDTDGCATGALPLGTPVEIRGASQPGTLAYSSWGTMAARGESDTDACRFNDFALVRIDPADHGRVNPSVPFFGGPSGTNTEGTGVLDKVVSYGNSSLRLGLTLLSPKEGYSLGTSGSGWTHTVYTVTPGVPGDSGSAVLDGQGRALGVVSTVAIAPLAGSNGISDFHRSLTYARQHGGMSSVVLAEGTEPFAGGFLP
jgi:hypothetical protein